jgi:hypothetical protein
MAHRMLGAKVDHAKTPPPYEQIAGNVKLTDEMSIDAPKVTFLDRNQFANFQMCIGELEKYADFGIVGVRPPPGASPPPLKFPTEGAEAWGDLKSERCVHSSAIQLYWKPAAKKPEEARSETTDSAKEEYVDQEHVFQVSVMDCDVDFSVGEFVRDTKLRGTFEPLSTDMEEACDLFWDTMQTSRDRTEEEARNSLRGGTLRANCAYAVDGSLYKKLGNQEGFIEVNEICFTRTMVLTMLMVSTTRYGGLITTMV